MIKALIIAMMASLTVATAVSVACDNPRELKQSEYWFDYNYKGHMDTAWDSDIRTHRYFMLNHWDTLQKGSDCTAQDAPLNIGEAAVSNLRSYWETVEFLGTHTDDELRKMVTHLVPYFEKTTLTSDDVQNIIRTLEFSDDDNALTFFKELRKHVLLHEYIAREVGPYFLWLPEYMSQLRLLHNAVQKNTDAEANLGKAQTRIATLAFLVSATLYGTTDLYLNGEHTTSSIILPYFLYEPGDVLKEKTVFPVGTSTKAVENHQQFLKHFAAVQAYPESTETPLPPHFLEATAKVKSLLIEIKGRFETLSRHTSESNCPILKRHSTGDGSSFNLPVERFIFKDLQLAYMTIAPLKNTLLELKRESLESAQINISALAGLSSTQKAALAVFSQDIIEEPRSINDWSTAIQSADVTVSGPLLKAKDDVIALIQSYQHIHSVLGDPLDRNYTLLMKRLLASLIGGSYQASAGYILDALEAERLALLAQVNFDLARMQKAEDDFDKKTPHAANLAEWLRQANELNQQLVEARTTCKDSHGKTLVDYE